METVKHTFDNGRQPMTDRAPPAPPPPSNPWSAPAASAPTVDELPTPPVDPAGVLDELVAVVHGALAALLASTDGFSIATSTELPDEPAHAAMLAAAVGLGHQLVQMGAGNELRQLVVDHDRGLLLVWPLGTNRILAMLTMTTVDQVRLRSFVRSRAGVLAGSGS